MFCEDHPDREIVVYANTSADVKAIADWVVTSSIALDVIDFLDSEGKKIIWGPDKHLGNYIQQKTKADMIMWDGACVVHEEFKHEGLKSLMNLHKDAKVLVHPESPQSVIELADCVGSTSQIIDFANNSPSKKFIVATDKGIFYQLIKNNPDSRRIIVSAWNPSVLDQIALPSCHAFFIFSVVNNKLNCHLTQRSGDIALGIPFNLACYATLTQMMAQEANLELGEFSHYINDAHIYVNHIEGLKAQLKREPFDPPKLEIAKKSFWNLEFEDFKLLNYKHHPPIKFPVAV